MALYFAFLASYTKFLIFISAAGALFYFFAIPYSTLFSSILLVWSVTFVEWWRIKQRILSVRWGTRGSFRVEKRRAQYQPIAWWKRELRILSSLPVILFFAAVLASVLTGIFVFEAFVTQLYKGPGAKFLVSPGICVTVLFLIRIYRALARRSCSCSQYPEYWLYIMAMLCASPTGKTTDTNRATMPR